MVSVHGVTIWNVCEGGSIFKYLSQTLILIGSLDLRSARAHRCALVAMVRKSLEAEERCESSVLHPACKDPKPRNSSELAGQAKLQGTVLDTSKKTLKRNFEAVISTPPPRSHNPFEDSVQRKVVGETTAETMSLLSASIENYCPENSESGGIKPVPGVSSFQYHVLAVDDSRIDQRVIEKLLRTSSYKVTTVNSALRALEVLGLSDTPPSSFKKLDINLIMTDYCMPEMTGYDLLKRVKAKTSAIKEIPVVVMSSENDSTRIKRCLAEGAEEFIIKPVQMSDVKRLRGHIRCSSTTSSSGTGESSGSTCGKRKADPSNDLHEISSPERRPRLSELLVT